MRIRSIKPEFWRSEDITALTWHDRLLFVGLWSYVDDNGVGIDQLHAIAADLFAGDILADSRETFARVSGGLQTLSAAGLITRYTVGGKPYLHITSWDKHQRIDKPAKGRYPSPTSGNAEIRESVATSSGDLPETVAPGTGEQGNRGTGKRGAADAATPRRKPAHALPADWEPTEAHRDFCRENRIVLSDELFKFRAHAEANDRRQVSWNGAFSQWLGQAKSYGASRERPAPQHIWEAS